MKLYRTLPLALLVLSLLGGGASAQEEGPAAPLLLILDASGSMWGQIEGENKIVIARRVLGGLVDGLDEGSEVGVIAYGHRREGDCDDAPKPDVAFPDIRHGAQQQPQHEPVDDPHDQFFSEDVQNLAGADQVQGEFAHADRDGLAA